MDRHPKPVVSYIVPLILAVSVTALVDGLLIVPMVEIDPSLVIVNNRSPRVERFRATAPMLAATVSILSLSISQALRIGRELGPSGDLERARSLVLRAPRFFGLTVGAGWVLALGLSVGTDLLTLEFPIRGEALAYYLSSTIAILSTALFGFLFTVVVTDQVNRIRMVPSLFPEGMVSRSASEAPSSLSGRLVYLWFGISFFPLLVLSLGFYTRQYVPENETRAYLFALIFAPISYFLVYRVGRGIQQPLIELLEATRLIGRGEYDLSIRSRQNDELAYLIDSTIEMSRGLKEKEFLAETFGRSVDPRVRDHLLAGNIALGGALKTAAVMFCDIRGFTTFSEGKREQQIVAILNEHFEAMEEAVGAHAGMINKFLGDGFLALFGLPVESEAPCLDAFEAARDLVEANRRLNEKRIARGEEALEIGVGLHFGPLVAGNLGSYRRSEYTVIGDAVNLASRVEGLCKRFRSRIVVTGAFAAQLPPELGSGELTDFGTVEVRGRKEEVRILGTAPLDE